MKASEKTSTDVGTGGAPDTDPLARVRRQLERTMPAALLERSRRINKLNSVYITSWRDDEFAARLDAFIANCKACVDGNGSRERALFVTGESGSGKSTLIARHLAKRAEFQPDDEDDERLPYIPMISFKLKEYAKPLEIAEAALDQLGLTTYNVRDDNLIFKGLKQRMMAQGTIYMHIDEMQHSILAQTPIAVGKIQDKVKTLLEWDGWPLHAIFSGTKEMDAFFQFNDQLANRKHTMELDPLDYAKHCDLVQDILHRICTRHAKLEPLDVIDERDRSFIHRIMRSASYEFGSTIQMIRAACVEAIGEGSATLEQRHFGQAFFNITAFPDHRNFFRTDAWEALPPGKLQPAERKPLQRKRARGR